MASGRSLLTGLFVGGIIGGAAVLLTAPSSGKQLREKMKTNYDSFEETIKRLKSDGLALKDQLIKAAKESTDVIKDVGGELQTSIKKMAGRDQASPAGSAKRNCRYRRENQTAGENLTKLISYSKEKNAGQNWTRI